MTLDELAGLAPAELRAAIRAGRWTGPTAGLARGFVQANLVILPAADAADFAEFCRLNPRPCPLLEQTAPGDPEPRAAAPGADLRSDVPRYRVFRHGQARSATSRPTFATCGATIWSASCSAVRSRSRMPCSTAGLPVRHIGRGSQRADVSHVARLPAGRTLRRRPGGQHAALSARAGRAGDRDHEPLSRRCTARRCTSAIRRRWAFAIWRGPILATP